MVKCSKNLVLKIVLFLYANALMDINKTINNLLGLYLSQNSSSKCQDQQIKDIEKRSYPLVSYIFYLKIRY